MVPVTAEQHASVVASEKIAHVSDFLTVCIGDGVRHCSTLDFVSWVDSQLLLLLLYLPECCDIVILNKGQFFLKTVNML